MEWHTHLVYGHTSGAHNAVEGATIEQLLLALQCWCEKEYSQPVKLATQQARLKRTGHGSDLTMSW